MSGEVWLDASIPGMREAGEAFFGFDPWECQDDVHVAWWEPRTVGAGPPYLAYEAAVPLHLAAGEALATFWLTQRWAAVQVGEHSVVWLWDEAHGAWALVEEIDGGCVTAQISHLTDRGLGRRESLRQMCLAVAGGG